MQKSVLVLLLFGISISSLFGQKTYESEWKEVESNVSKGLPQSALKIVDQIYLQSKAENNAPQFLKAAIYQVKLRADYQEDFMESSIAQVREELMNSREPIRQILHSIEAELYWRYYQGNRYKFMERTAVSNPDTADIKTWDIRMLDNAVSYHYLSSLVDEDQLKKINLDPYDPILDTAKGSKLLRPTLYDFLAHRALDYFMNNEIEVTKPAPPASASTKLNISRRQRTLSKSASSYTVA